MELSSLALIRAKDDLSEKIIVSVVGCGGKTTFIKTLSESIKNKKVLITTTTKIRPEQGTILINSLDDCIKHIPKEAVYCYGVINESSGKLEAMPLHILKDVVSKFDIALIEADGSKGIACKGWRDYEPVVPNYTTYTVGIITLSSLNKAVSDETVFRQEEFKALTKIKSDERIDYKHIARMLCERNGMFYKSVGKKILCINKVESSEGISMAKKLAEVVKKEYGSDFFDKIVYGSAMAASWNEV